MIPDRADVALLAAILFALIVFHFSFTARVLRAHDAATRKYRFCAVRDRLISLVAEGHIREDSPAFRLFYKASNSLVGEPDYLDLGKFIRFLKEKDMAQPPDFDRIAKEVEENKLLAATIGQFYQAVISTIWDNSLLLRVLVRCRKFLLRKKENSHLPPIQRQAYKVYRDYSRASSRLLAIA